MVEFKLIGKSALCTNKENGPNLNLTLNFRMPKSVAVVLAVTLMFSENSVLLRQRCNLIYGSVVIIITIITSVLKYIY